MKKTIALAAVLFAGCATTEFNPIEAATEHTVTVNWNQGMELALSAAEQHCQKYGKHAQFAGKEDYWLFYNCV